MFKSVVLIPTYNEAKSIESLLHDLGNLSLDIIVIDDNSPDRTAFLIKKLNYSNVRLIENGAKGGIGAAYLAGLEFALKDGYDIIATMDADGSHLVNDLKNMLDTASTFDVVMGTRWVKGGSVHNWSLHRRILSQFGTWYARKALSLPFRDLTGGLRVYKGTMLRKLNLNSIRSNGYCFQIEMIRACSSINSVIKEVPITFIEREQGESKMNAKIVIEAFWRVTLWGFMRLIGINADKLHYVK